MIIIIFIVIIIIIILVVVVTTIFIIVVVVIIIIIGIGIVIIIVIIIITIIINITFGWSDTSPLHSISAPYLSCSLSQGAILSLCFHLANSTPTEMLAREDVTEPLWQSWKSNFCGSAKQ